MLGLKVYGPLPLTPVPVQVPPAGEPPKMIGEALLHKGPYDPQLIVGAVFTVMVV